MRIVKDSIKSVAFRAFPELTLKALSIRSRRIIENQVKELGLDRLAREISKRTGGRVASGPFKGMRLDYDALPVHGAPKLLGTYEKELHSVVERAISLSPRHVLNVGCAEGFYAVGLALRLPEATVFFADADPKAEQATMINAKLNNADGRVKAVGIMKPGTFWRYLQFPNSLLVMDCEGAEFSLLNPNTDPILLCVNTLVEVHQKFGNASEIATRFTQHRITLIEPKPRAAADSPFPDLTVSALDDRTGDKSWLFIEPR